LSVNINIARCVATATVFPSFVESTPLGWEVNLCEIGWALSEIEKFF